MELPYENLKNLKNDKCKNENRPLASSEINEARQSPGFASGKHNSRAGL